MADFEKKLPEALEKELQMQKKPTLNRDQPVELFDLLVSIWNGRSTSAHFVPEE